MGSRTFDFLADSFLLDETLIAENYRSVSEADLKRELERYRDFTSSTKNELVDEIVQSSSKFRVFPGIERAIDLQLLLQRSALYIEQFILDDPLFSAASTSTEQGKVLNQALGMSDGGPDRHAVAKAAESMRLMRHAVSLDVVKFLPFSVILEPSPETPILFSEDRFASSLPADILRFMRSRVQVRSSRKDANGYFVGRSLEPSRSIVVDFRDANPGDTRAYHLFAHELTDVDEASQTVGFSLRLPETLPESDEFEAWVDQSINQTARSVFEHLRLEQRIASDLVANFLTTSQFTHDLLRLRIKQSSYEIETANTLLNIELPFLEGITLEDILTVRAREGEAFAHFRQELEARFIPLQGIENAATRRNAAKEVMRQFGQHELPLVEKAIKRTRKTLMIDAGIGMAGLIAAIPAAGIWPPGAIVCAAGVALGVVKGVRDAVSGGRNNRAFFLWKVMRRRR